MVPIVWAIKLKSDPSGTIIFLYLCIKSNTAGDSIDWINIEDYNSNLLMRSKQAGDTSISSHRTLGGPQTEHRGIPRNEPDNNVPG